MRGAAALAFLLLAAAVGFAQEPEIHGLERFGGSPAARESLLRRGFVVTDETRRQIFSFYVGQDRIFVTTDCLLHTYFANVEESLKALETLQFERLRKLIRHLRERLAKLSAEGEASLDALVEGKNLDPRWRTAADDLDAYLQVAETLLGGPPPADGPVAREVALILAAKGDAQSPLRGIPLDYARFDPSAAPVPSYHRAITWLYDVPFRIADDQEMRQAMLLSAIDDMEDGSSASSFASPYHEFLGPGDDADLDACAVAFDGCVGSLEALAREPERWARAREALARLLDPRHPTTPTREAVVDPRLFKGIRFLARPLLVDNDVFKALAPPGLMRPLPSGEELMAALGSKAAETVIREGVAIPGYEGLLADAKAAVARADAQPLSLLREAQRAVFRSLLDPPLRADLPAYYLHPDWRFKDLNTCLAGWAHDRNLWASHAKVTMFYTADVEGSRGLIEPNEPFFGSLLDLTIATGAFFARHGVPKHRFSDLAELIAELRVALRAQLEGRPGPAQGVFTEFGPRLAWICGFGGNSWLADEDLPDHTFGVPVVRDLESGTRRWVGQGRPHALYVVAEQDGRRLMFVGGVLSYRDYVESGEEMTADLWKKRAGDGTLPAPEWHARFRTR